MTLEKWMLFATVWTFAALPIGPNALNCIQTSVAVGFRKSLWSVIGILIASVVFMSIVFSGVAVLLQTNDFIFFLIQLIGASYLFWLGIKMFYNSSKLTISEIDVNLSNTAIVRSAFLISLSNPKAIIAYLSIFSQFVDAQYFSSFHIFILAFTSIFIGGVVYSLYCIIGSNIKYILSDNSKYIAFNRLIGFGYMLLSAILISSLI